MARGELYTITKSDQRRPKKAVTEAPVRPPPPSLQRAITESVANRRKQKRTRRRQKQVKVTEAACTNNLHQEHGE